MSAWQHARTPIDVPKFQTEGPRRIERRLGAGAGDRRELRLRQPVLAACQVPMDRPHFQRFRRSFRPRPALVVSGTQHHRTRLAVNAANKRELARAESNHQIRSRAIASLLFFCRWLLLQGLKQDDVLDRYDRFVITRSDFVWLCPHPPLSVLDRSAIWFPNGEHWGGLNDRHLVVSRTDVVNCLDLIEDILLEPNQLYEELKYMKGQTAWYNIE